MKNMHLNRLATACVALASLLGAQASVAQDDIKYRISGFGTLGGVITDEGDTGFRTSVAQREGAGNSLDLGVDSRIALQGSVTYKDSLTVTAQILGLRREDDNFKVGFEWAYLQYTGIPGLDLKAGRVVLPAFLVSDSRLVGYATPWLRVSPLVYAMMPLSNVDGGQISYRHSVGPAVVSGQVTHGRAKTTSYGTQQTGPTSYAESITGGKTRDIWGLNLGLEWGDWQFRVSQVKGDADLSTSVTLPIFGTVVTPLPIKDKFTEVGVQYDNGQWMVAAEYVKRKTDPAVQNAKAWYLGGGYRFGSVMPYVMFSEFEITRSTVQTPLPPKAKGTALGVRWDFASNLALKAELARYRNNSSYIFTDTVSPSVADKNINVMSIALDFVF